MSNETVSGSDQITPDETIVRLKNVSKTIQGKSIVKNLSFSVRRGEIYGFLGPNGAGKTTTIRMMVGLMSITEGDIYIAGHNIKTDRRKAMSHVGAIVENPELYGYMSGWKNLVHFARMSETAVTKERMIEMVKLLDLEDAIHRKVKTYSLGMKQRLGIVQALLHKPSVLLLDEPTNGLDPSGIRQLRDYLRHLAKTENIGIVVCSHLLAEAELMCDRVVIIKNGLLVGERSLNRGESPGTMKLPVMFEVDEASTVSELLAAYGVTMQEGRNVTVEVEKDSIPQIVASLSGRGVRIYQIRTTAPTLEDMYLSLTGKEERRYESESIPTNPE